MRFRQAIRLSGLPLGGSFYPLYPLPSPAYHSKIDTPTSVGENLGIDGGIMVACIAKLLVWMWFWVQLIIEVMTKR